MLIINCYSLIKHLYILKVYIYTLIILNIIFALLFINLLQLKKYVNIYKSIH